jgi:hypothetical protein
MVIAVRAVMAKSISSQEKHSLRHSRIIKSFRVANFYDDIHDRYDRRCRRAE